MYDTNWHRNEQRNKLPLYLILFSKIPCNVTCKSRRMLKMLSDRHEKFLHHHSFTGEIKKNKSKKTSEVNWYITIT